MSRAHPLLAILLALAPLVLGGCDPEAEERQAIKDTYEAFEAAGDAGDARTCISLLTQRSIAEYDKILQAANTAGAAEVVQMPAIDRLMLLGLRNRIPLEERKKMDGRAALTRIISERWWSDDDGDDDDEVTFGETRINGEYARVRVIWEGKRTGYSFDFIKENDHGQPDPAGTWRLDEPSCKAFYNELFARLCEKAGVSGDQVFVVIEAADTGAPVRRDIWDRP